jgi:arylsulfatase A-like enzyme
VTAPRRTLAALALAAVTVAAALAAACGGDDPGGGPPARAPGRYDADGRLVSGRRAQTALPNVLLLVLDTTRRDAVEPDGEAPPVMPELASFLSRHTWFVDAASQASWTAPSVTTVLTGLAPWRHGVGGFFKSPPLVASVATLAEYLRAIGYQTAAFTGGGWVASAMGHGQGYDLGDFSENWGFEDPRRELERWMEKQRRPDKPLFLLLHTYEAHDPYGRKFPPEGSDDPERVAEVNALVRTLMERVGPDPDADLPLDLGLDFLIRMRTDPLLHYSLMSRFGRPRVLRALTSYDRDVYAGSPERKRVEDVCRARYRLGLAALDEAFARLLERLDRLGLTGNAVTIVCTDHGESFGEHQNLGHGRWLYDELARVVLGVRAPGRFPDATRIPGPCGLVDVLPTVLDLCGLPPPTDLDGESLLPLARGAVRRRPVRAEDFQRGLYTGLGAVDLRVHSVRTERGKWIGTFDRGAATLKEEVFDLSLDPGEQKVLPASAIEGFGPEFVHTVEEARERLRSLGQRPR